MRTRGRTRCVLNLLFFNYLLNTELATSHSRFEWRREFAPTTCQQPPSHSRFEWRMGFAPHYHHLPRSKCELEALSANKHPPTCNLSDGGICTYHHSLFNSKRELEGICALHNPPLTWNVSWRVLLPTTTHQLVVWVTEGIHAHHNPLPHSKCELEGFPAHHDFPSPKRQDGWFPAHPHHSHSLTCFELERFSTTTTTPSNATTSRKLPPPLVCCHQPNAIATSRWPPPPPVSGLSCSREL